MKENLKDILSNLNPEVDQEALLNYLQGKLSAEQQHEVEKARVDDNFEADAMEGLEGFKNKQKLSLLIEQLNNDLKKKTAKKKKWQQKKEIKIEPWLLQTIVILLLLIIICYLALSSLRK